MKKVLFSAFLFVCASMAIIKAQPTLTPVTDTLHYYFNKMYFKEGPKVVNSIYGKFDAKSYSAYKSAAATSTVISHVGNKFENKDTLIITGLEGFIVINLYKSQATIKAHLYLCNLDANDMPVLPPIDSVITTVGGGTLTYSGYGGNFTKPRVVTKDFAVLIRNMSTVKGDTIRIMRTGSMTYTAWPNVNWSQKYSDSYGYVRSKGVFYKAKDFNLPEYGFTVGSDYEFCLAPRVQYTLSANHIPPVELAAAQPVCTFKPLTYTNASSFHFMNRMFNLLEFYRKWNLLSDFKLQPTIGWSADTAITWNFLDMERGPTRPDPRTFLPYGGATNQIIHYSDSASDANCFAGCEFRANLRPMGLLGNVPQITNKQSFTLCTEYCAGDAMGIAKNDYLQNVNVYPNPISNGKVNVTGLTGINTIRVYDILGQLISSEIVEQEKLQIDLSKQAKGNYLVRITNQNGGKAKVVKIQKIE